MEWNMKPEHRHCSGWLSCVGEKYTQDTHSACLLNKNSYFIESQKVLTKGENRRKGLKKFEIYSA